MARKRGAKDAVAPAPEPEPEPEPAEAEPQASKPKRASVKMTDKQKADLNKHMDKVGKDMTLSERKSHRMKMMSRMRRGDSVAKAHKDIMSS
jgi:hypothetical protein